MAFSQGEVPNATWYLDWSKNEFKEYWEAYNDRYHPARQPPVQEPAPEALRLYQDIKQKEDASRYK